MKIELKNGNILVKEIEQEDEEVTSGGKKNSLIIILPKETKEDEQVSQGLVIQDADEYKKGDIVMFHKTLPVDVNMKLDGDKNTELYFFIQSRDVICKIIN